MFYTSLHLLQTKIVKKWRNVPDGFLAIPEIYVNQCVQMFQTSFIDKMSENPN